MEKKFSIRKNLTKKTDKHPDYVAVVMFGGEEHSVAGWMAADGSIYISISRSNYSDKIRNV